MLFLSLLSQQMKLKLILLSTVGVIIVEDVVVIIEEEVHLEAEEVVIMAGPAERRRRRVEVVGLVGAMIGVTWVGVTAGEDDWMVGMPCIL